jgi:tRNA(Phe) wybutosine-synthesizing methylase Tyw3
MSEEFVLLTVLSKLERLEQKMDALAEKIESVEEQTRYVRY